MTTACGLLRRALQPFGPLGADVALDRVARQVEAAGAFQRPDALEGDAEVRSLRIAG
jgi:hypothetical protein